MYADDTAILCAGNDIATAQRRAQRAADTLVQWATAAKMRVAGEKTQVLALSQAPRDATDCAIKVAGEVVTCGEKLKLLGVTLERTLHFGAHCKSLRSKTRPRIAQLRKLTGRSWGLKEEQLRTVASGYVRGPLKHAAAAWLPATPASNVEVLEREVRAAGRVITGCPTSTRKHALVAEAGQVTVDARRRTLAARFLAKARALPAADPLRIIADAAVPRRLSSVTGWREVGLEVWRAAGVTSPIEPALTRRLPPWSSPAGVTFRLDIGPGLPLGAGAQKKKEVADNYLAALPQRATWVWTDGSAEGGVTNGGAGALIEFPDGETAELREATGRLCSSYRAEMVALRAALTHLREHPAHDEDSVVLCTDSQAALAKLRRGPPGQEAPIGAEIWRLLAGLASADRPFILQWVPSHCGLPGNERADTLAGQASALPQDDVPVDARTVHRAAARVARSHAIAHWPPGWYRSLMAGRLPPPVRRFERETAVDIHQIRAGHWSGSTLHSVPPSHRPKSGARLRPVCRAPVPGELVPGVRRGAGLAGAHLETLPGTDDYAVPFIRHHLPVLRGRQAGRRGGGPGGGHQVPTEPTGYDPLSGSGGNYNNNNNLDTDAFAEWLLELRNSPKADGRSGSTGSVRSTSRIDSSRSSRLVRQVLAGERRRLATGEQQSSGAERLTTTTPLHVCTALCSWVSVF